jgi:branched-chain amino acid transport system permease protein
MRRSTRARIARLFEPQTPPGRALVGTAVLGTIVLGLCVLGLAASNSTLVTIFLINLVAVVGLGVFVGNSGVVSFGHAGFMGLAAYASGLLSMDPIVRDTILTRFPDSLANVSLPLALALPAALGLVAVLALVSGLAISALPRDAAAIATLGVLVIVNVTLLASETVTSGAQPLYGVTTGVTWPMALACALVAMALARLFRESRSGLHLRASREDELAAQAFGVNVRAVRLQSWVLSAVIAGAGGALLGHFLGAFSPSQFYLTTTIAIVAMLILGGANTVSGAVMGTALVTVVTEVLSHFENGTTIGPLDLPELFGLPTLGLGLVLVGTMYLRRDGLFGKREIDVSIARRLLGERPAPPPPATDERPQHEHDARPAGSRG